MEIQIISLKKSYGKKTVLDNVSLTFTNGMYGLLGRNGAGKTTLMQILSTLQKASAGEILFNGVSVKEVRKIRSMIGYLPQEFSFYPNMTVMEIMNYLAALSDIPAEEGKRRIPELLKQVNLWNDRRKIARKLSGGMKQRLGIAQALLSDPQVLIVDEPTVGLDPEERLRFYGLLGEFSENRIVVVSSHIVSDIEMACENVVVLDCGRILFSGSVGQLADMAQGKIFELTVPKSKKNEIQEKYHVLFTQEHSLDVKLRVLSERIPKEDNCISCIPDVSDGYMAMLYELEREGFM